MAVQTIEVEDETRFYAIYNTHIRAIVAPEDKLFNRWDTVMFTNPAPRWKNLPIFRSITYIEKISDTQILLHLK